MLRITCQQASRLLSQRMEAPLGAGMRLRLRLHLFVCDACTRVARQFAAIRLAMQTLRERD
ncbi:MAG: zf-HC2 domain-containing protein [Rudaea sp.]|uniref:anti-sigma factor family protein n=1 Tax=unclassified Rudaea TaxID=2627037 RepID=UPI0010F6BE53|nr:MULTISPECIES: zf-HC2 domain-containing protein [unclassified Rudaea]MBN8884744.1 zf-HC2 domain-containing protein [Rudaea sp.]